MDNKKGEFAGLFKKFRLKSGFATLREFADALAQEGLVYEESLFSRWQKGDRVPKDRHLILTLINIFSKKGGITTIEELNSFLASANLRDLDKEELKQFSKIIIKEAPFTVPSELPIFIGRERCLKEIGWKLLNKELILIYGIAGIGKTALAIKITHILKDKFKDGILWYRCDVKKVDEILDDIASVFAEDITRVKDRKIKTQIVINLLSHRNILLVFDNLETVETLEPFLEIKELPFPLLITSKYSFESLKRIRQIKISGFTDKEMIQLAKEILGTPFVLMNLDKLRRLAKLIEYNPLALTVLMKQLEISPFKLNSFIDRFEKETSFLYQSAYDNKTLYQSLSFSFESLPSLVKQVFTSLGVFHGSDFSSEAAAFINEITPSEAIKKLNYLQRFSFVEKSAYRRYGLHPLIATFIRSKGENKTLFNKLAQYFLRYLSRFERGTSENYALFEKDFENILGIFEKCNKFGFYKRIVELWNFIGVFLWDRGYWIKMRNYEKMIVAACKKIRDDKVLALCYVRELSWLYFWQGKVEKAKAYGEKGLYLALKIEDDFIIALAKQRLGMVYLKQNQLTKAERCLKETLYRFKKLNKKTFIGDTLLYLGHVLRKKKKLQEAEQYYLKSYLRLKTDKEHEGTAIALYYLGEINLIKKQLDKALKFFSKALLIDRLKNRRAGIAWCNYGLGQAQLLKGKISEGQKLLQLARKIFLYLGMNEQVKLIEEKKPAL